MTLEGLQPRPAKTAYEYVLRTLREEILSGRLGPGTRLLQSDIARQLQVSTTPVREALRDLTKEGLVTFDSHRGARVRTIEMSTVREIYELRILLEPLMIKRTIHELIEEHFTRAEALWHQMDVEQNISQWIELNRQFHSVFAEPAKGGRLASILTGLRDAAAPYVALSLGAEPSQTVAANKEHGLLVKHFRAGDVVEATNLTRKHLQSTLAVIEEANRGGLFDATPRPA